MPDRSAARLRVLGSLELVDPNGRALAAVVSQPKRVALLCYLALADPPGFHRRDRLLALFWPELDTERARASLRQSIWFLRESLGRDVIVGRGEELGLAADALQCDALEFLDAVRVAAHDEALRLYRGDFLDGFHVEASAELSSWIDDRRQSFRRLAANAAIERAEFLATSDPPASADNARFALSLASWDESLVRRAVSAIDRAGDRAGAVAAYESFAARLRDQLEVEPAPETRTLIDDIRARIEPAPGPRIARAAPSALEPAPAAPGRRKPAILRTLGLGAASLGLIGLALALFARDDRAASRTRPPHEPDSVSARLYEEGMHFLAQMTDDDLQRAAHDFSRATTRDSLFTAAWIGLSRAYAYLGLAHAGMPPQQAYARARYAAQRALALEPSSGEAYDLLAVLAEYDHEWETAEAYHREAVRLAPASPDAWRNFAQYLNGMRRSHEAVSVIDTALRLDGLSKITLSDAAVTYWVAGRHVEALGFAHQALELDPRFHPAHWIAGEIHLSLEQMDSARAHAEASAELARTAGFDALLASFLARTGDAAAARRMLASLEGRLDEPFVALSIGLTHAALDQPDSAFHWLHRSARLRDPNLGWAILFFPGVERIRDDARYAQLVQDLRLPVQPDAGQ